MSIFSDFFSSQKAKTTADIPIKEENLLPKEIYDMCIESAKNFSVIPDIHPNDYIFHFLITNPTFPTKKDAIDYYFTDGAKSAEKLSRLIYSDLQFEKHIPLSLMEFASGYGCVTRHLSQHFPNINIISCDIHQEAVRFLNKTLLINTILSESVPDNLKLNEKFNIIFALSFFSHMPRSTWGRWIKTLYSGLMENGYLIFTTHGMESRQYMGNPIIPEDGFWFLAQSEQKDLDAEEYGLTIVTPDFVVQEITQMTGAPIFRYQSAFWWGHQDLYIIKKH